MNWCNVAAVMLMTHLVLTAATWKIGIEEIPDICLALLVANLALGIIVTLTQSYTPVFTRLDSRPIKSYQVTNSYYYLANGRLAHDYSIYYVPEGDFSGEIIELNRARYEDVCLRIDAINPRVEKITYCQNLVDHCIIGGDVILGTAVVKKELVIYLPDISEAIEKPSTIQNN